MNFESLNIPPRRKKFALVLKVFPAFIVSKMDMNKMLWDDKSLFSFFFNIVKFLGALEAKQILKYVELDHVLFYKA